jgi:hypothetical protein
MRPAALDYTTYPPSAGNRQVGIAGYAHFHGP